MLAKQKMWVLLCVFIQFVGLVKDIEKLLWIYICYDVIEEEHIIALEQASILIHNIGMKRRSIVNEWKYMSCQDWKELRSYHD